MNKIIFTTVFLLITFAMSALALQKKDMPLPDELTVHDYTFVMNGSALREKFVFDVYIAALYLTEKSHDAESILQKDAPRIMSMKFLRDVAATKINKAWIEGLDSNTPKVTNELRQKFDTLASLMPDIKDGDTMSFIYIPEQGTEVTVVDQVVGVIKGKDFADAILATWIGPKPGPGKAFKKKLLGN